MFINNDIGLLHKLSKQPRTFDKLKVNKLISTEGERFELPCY